jgi:hypothetical protein
MPKKFTRLIKYNTGKPPVTGVYAIRTETPVPGLLEDLFLLWDNDLKRWYHCGSDQGYRKEVKYWIGPLQRKLG